MSIPDYQAIMLPLLKIAGDGKEHSVRDAGDRIADLFHLTEEERKELLPSGQQEVLRNRVGWSKTYLVKAALIKSKRRGFFEITDRGKKVLAENLTELNVKYLERFEEFNTFRSARHDKNDGDKKKNDDEATPEEALESAYGRLRASLAEELLEQIKTMSPSLFEKLVVELLLKMGYGGSRKDAGEAIGKSGDEGIDGIIKEDRLGLDIIYIQAKRWEGTVGRPEVQKFAGALQGQRARKGIMLTTSSFSQDARNYVRQIESKIVLIDGDELAGLMIDHNIGVSPVSVYEIKRIDSDYFSE